ncbi:hypothetical protein Acy02nite_04760 [Actinoplanes cyaneus]|uniref:Tetratricopeptide repeat protein n=1 Tax=Actinoplanes cyaneus TaxID=52696 RepID=A0A919IAP3_9ACTN|nr:hypothetical protein [Actinoplanes cyaneus]MCW2136037.1 hypothetical protein [Actinoplanes cyaneus]GID62595.1 hypothetical protein Acy02nite_04760 [Actinoplanes cyaneus]
MSFEDDEYWDEEYNEYSFMPKYAVAQERHFEKRTAPDPVIPTRRPAEGDKPAARRSGRNGEKPAVAFDDKRPSWLDDPNFVPIDTSVDNLSGNYFDDVDFNRPELGMDFDKPDFPIVDPAALQNPERQRRRPQPDGRPAGRYGARRHDDLTDDRGRARDDRRDDSRGRHPAERRDERWADDRRDPRRETDRRDGAGPRRQPAEAGPERRLPDTGLERRLPDGGPDRRLPDSSPDRRPLDGGPDRRLPDSGPDRRWSEDERGRPGERRGGSADRPAARRDYVDERDSQPWQEDDFGPIRPPGGRRPRREDEEPRRGPTGRPERPAAAGRATVPGDDRYDGRGRPQDVEAAHGNGHLRDDDLLRGSDLVRGSERVRDDELIRADELVRGTGRARDEDLVRGTGRALNDELVRGTGLPRDEDLVRGGRGHGDADRESVDRDGYGRDDLAAGRARVRDDESARRQGWDDEPVDLQAREWDKAPANADWTGGERTPEGWAADEQSAHRDDRSRSRDDHDEHPVVLDGEYYETPDEPATPGSPGDDKPRVLRRADPPVQPKVVSRATPPPTPRVIKNAPPVTPRVVAAPPPAAPARVVGPAGPQIPAAAAATSAPPPGSAPGTAEVSLDPRTAMAPHGESAPPPAPSAPSTAANRPVSGTPQSPGAPQLPIGHQATGVPQSPSGQHSPVGPQSPVGQHSQVGPQSPVGQHSQVGPQAPAGQQSAGFAQAAGPQQTPNAPQAHEPGPSQAAGIPQEPGPWQSGPPQAVPQQRTGRSPRTAHVFLADGDGPWAIVPDDVPPMPPHPTGRTASPARGPVPVDARAPMPLDARGPIPVDARGPMPVDARGPMPVDPRGPIPADSRGPIPVDARGPVPVDGRGPTAVGRPTVPAPGAGQTPVQPGVPRTGQPVMPPPGLIAPQAVTPRPVVPQTATPPGRVPPQPAAPPPGLVAPQPAAPPPGLIASQPAVQPGAPVPGNPPGNTWDPRQTPQGRPNSLAEHQESALPRRPRGDTVRPVSPAAQWAPGPGDARPVSAPTAQWDQGRPAPAPLWDQGQPAAPDATRPVSSPAAQWGQGQPPTPDTARPVSAPAGPWGPAAGRPVSPAGQWTHAQPGNGQAGHAQPAHTQPGQHRIAPPHAPAETSQAAQLQPGQAVGPVVQQSGAGHRPAGEASTGHPGAAHAPVSPGGFLAGDGPTGELPQVAQPEDDGWGPRAGQRPVSPAPGQAPAATAPTTPAQPAPAQTAPAPTMPGQPAQPPTAPATPGQPAQAQTAATAPTTPGQPAQTATAPAFPGQTAQPVTAPASPAQPAPGKTWLPAPRPGGTPVPEAQAPAISDGPSPGSASPADGAVSAVPVPAQRHPVDEPSAGPDAEPVPYMDPDGTLHNLKPIARLAVSGPDQEPRRYSDPAFGSGWFVAKTPAPDEAPKTAPEAAPEEGPEAAATETTEGTTPEAAGGKTAATDEPGSDRTAEGKTGKQSAPEPRKQPEELGKHLPLSAADLDAIRWRLDGGTLREVVDDRDALRELGERLDGPLADEADNIVKAGLLSVRAEVYRLLGELGMAAAASRLALAHAESAKDEQSMVIAQAELAHVLRLRGDWREADRLFQRAVDSDVSTAVRSVVHENAGRSAFDQGRHMEALDHFARAIRLGASDDSDLVERVGVCLEAVYIHVLRDGWGPYPRRPEEILAPLSGRNADEPAGEQSGALDETTAEQRVVTKRE